MALDYGSLTDAQLLEAVSRKDSEALSHLYDKYAPILYSLIDKIVDDEPISQELLADVFSIIWQKAKFFDSSSDNAYCWLVTLARNKSVDHMRRVSDAGVMEEYSDDYENYFLIPRLSPMIDPLDLETALSISQNIEDALMKLTEAQQYVIFLAYYDGLTQNQIAHRLKIPVETVQAKIQSALSSMKDKLIKGE